MLLHAVYSVLVDALSVALFLRPRDQAQDQDRGSFADRRPLRDPVRAGSYPHLAERYRGPGCGRDPNLNRPRS